MDRQTRKLLRDALGATEEILEYTSGVDFREFSSDKMRQRATYFAFAVLGEALNQLLKQEPSYQADLPEAQMSIDMRNRLIHGYSSIDVGIVWATVKQDIPNLRDELHGLLSSR